MRALSALSFILLGFTSLAYGADWGKGTIVETDVGVMEIDKKLGAGDYGSVYLAHSYGQPAATFAIKRVSGSHVDAATLRQIEQDNQLVAESHMHLEFRPKIAHIVPSAATHQSAETVFVATNAVSDLEVIAGRYSPLSDQERVALAAKVLDEVMLELHELAQSGYAHNDIKESNILLSKKGHFALTDFDAVTPWQQTPKMAGINVAPEIFLNQGSQVSTLSDVYSLGVVLASVLDPSNYAYDSWRISEVVHFYGTEQERWRFSRARFQSQLPSLLKSLKQEKLLPHELITLDDVTNFILSATEDDPGVRAGALNEWAHQNHVHSAIAQKKAVLSTLDEIQRSKGVRGLNCPAALSE